MVAGGRFARAAVLLDLLISLFLLPRLLSMARSCEPRGVLQLAFPDWDSRTWESWLSFILDDSVCTDPGSLVGSRCLWKGWCLAKVIQQGKEDRSIWERVLCWEDKQLPLGAARSWGWRWEKPKGGEQSRLICESIREQSMPSSILFVSARLYTLGIFP